MASCGIISVYASSVAPVGWLLCDGAAVSRTIYANLFSVISTTYGTGDGSTTFNLPNLQGRVPVGVNSTYTIASTGGTSTVTLTAAQSGIPAHAHGLNSHTHTYDKANTPTGSTAITSDQMPSHSHTYVRNRLTSAEGYDTGWGNNYGTKSTVTEGVKTGSSNKTGGGKGHTHTISYTSTNSGAASWNTANNTAANASSAHNNMQPYIALNYIIKY